MYGIPYTTRHHPHVLLGTNWKKDMDTSSIFGGVISNLLWALLLGAFGIIAFKCKSLREIPNNLRLGTFIRNHGIHRMTFSRKEYPERLDEFIDHANHSIRIVSISFKLTSAEASLVELFRRKLASNQRFQITISLLHPGSAAAKLAAASLDIKPEQLNKEIREMLEDLIELRNQLSLSDKTRLRILTHRCLPMGSAILLDSDEKNGMIQVETKLYRSPRVDSLSFLVKPSGEFYRKNLIAWDRVIQESVPYSA
jgi:hypothetical protein